MKKKRSLTLIEIVVAMVLLGILLTGLFNYFYATLKKSIEAKELKQKVLHLELFQQRLKVLFGHRDGDMWMETHPDAVGAALFWSYEQSADPDPCMNGSLLAMLYLNAKKELCLASWCPNDNGRVETLLDKVDAFKCRLFDPKAAEWETSWPKKKEDEPPVMVGIDLKWGGKEFPFVFFVSDEQISYAGLP